MPDANRRVGLSCALLVFATAAHAAVLDGFTGAFPINPCLPHTGAPVLFSGPYCDGVACPPDDYADPSCDGAYVVQAAPAGVVGGAVRSALVDTQTLTATMTARVLTVPQRLQVDRTAGEPGDLDLQYGDTPIPQQMNLDLHSFTEFVFTVDGDPSPSTPLHLTIGLYTVVDPTTSHGTTASIVLDHAGIHTIPFSSMPPFGGFTFSDVDWITVKISDCEPGGDCPPSPPARSYALGPIRIEGTATATKHTTWSRLKSHYR